MRYPASEKAEIIQLVEQSHLPAGCTLDKLAIPRVTFTSMDGSNSAPCVTITDAHRNEAHM
jgi:hypothetical protein